ncbi:hypothetical protein N7471_006758 [Penicillium samsonianum]|uniref:uncharacterized protein n=1 Tax=Penicillium samsonianum TaxID=1882272 RepID=UPI002547FEFB|nr:uncharacterized protein N7471_006758 [Penicillium samsonianum]KAJ6140272.1 hypothetical protein N7471_006758 [Penicillium samsonianum]
MAAVISHIDSQSTPCSGFTDNTTLFQQPISNIAPVLVDSHQAEATAPHNGTDDDTFGKTGLATCSEIKFAPSTKRLLEACKTNCGEFLRAISEAKAAFPTGQGWEAAIATKKENADIRDLMRIYHRFECYNIYRHVVEAGYHTGTHWIREMRAVLANKLCRDFPGRFQNQKTANKCLNWVDQGCSYHEWTEILSETPNLGYLIALPSDVSHSAYTSRCTKEKMNTAVLKFKSLGIDDVVKNLKLAELGNNIAAKLREMTGKKRKDVNGERTIQSSRKSPRLTSSSSILALTLQSGQKTTAPESMAAANQHLFDHPTESLMSTSAQEHVGNHGRQDQNTSGSVADDYVVPYDPFNNLGLNSPAYSELFMHQYSAISIPFDEWYQHPNYAEGCATN